MTGRYDENDNVKDFIEFKMHQLVEIYAKTRPDIAKVLSEALDEYLLGNHDITFVDDWPHIVKETYKSAKSAKRTEQD